MRVCRLMDQSGSVFCLFVFFFFFNRAGNNDEFKFEFAWSVKDKCTEEGKSSLRRVCLYTL